MNRKELIEAVLKDRDLSHLSKKDADKMVSNILDVIRKTVKKGDDVSLVGFGTFSNSRWRKFFNSFIPLFVAAEIISG